MINKVILMGRLTADPELRQTQNGVATCTFTVAIQRNFVPQGGERQSDFITVVAWRQTAEFVCKYFSKGKMIIVEGSLRTRTYDDKRYPDVKHYVTEVFADNVTFGESKAASGGQSNGYQNTTSQTFAPPQRAQQESANSSIAVGDFSDFEEVIGDSDLPF